jgi:hypothetical protein
VKDKFSRFRVSVLWVQSIDETTAALSGRKFSHMEPSWVDEKKKVSHQRFHSYIVSNILDDEETFQQTDLLGKGSCLILSGFDPKTKDFKKPHANQVWIFDFLDHCIER